MSLGARFLVHPELFPARIAGEASGDESLVLEIAGQRHAVSGLSPSQADGVRERFRGFLHDSPGPRPTGSRVFRMAPVEFRSVDTRGWDYDLDLEHGESFVRIAGLRFVARLDWRPELTGALWTAASDEEFPGVFENYLRVLVAYGLVEAGGALVHSAGILDDDGAHLFVGVSGAGKSSFARLSLGEGRRVLSDDLNAVAPHGAGFAALAVPFAGDLRTEADTGAHPLRSIVRLVKGREHAWSGSRPAETLALLASCAPCVNRDPFRAERLLANLAAIVAATECRRMVFGLHPGVWDAQGVEA